MRTREKNLAILFVVLAVLAVASPAWSSDLRILSMGNARIALDDEDNRLNPYDFGRNAAYLLRDYESHWTRLDAVDIDGVVGDLRRPYDPREVFSYSAAAKGIQKLGKNHVITGSIRFGWLNNQGVTSSLELDQYNDPFYMTDQTRGDFQHDGPSMAVDYSLRLHPKVLVGAGFDFDLSTGLKDVYTRPEIVHDHFLANLGAIYEIEPNWTAGLIVRPRRTQNRTEFEKTDEGFDNLIYRYYGDAIYDIFATSSYTVREVAKGIELGVQNFYTADQWGVGAQFSYDIEENEIKYGTSTQELLGYWQDTAYDIAFTGRYMFEGMPLTLGASGRFMTDDGWARRPEYEDVLLYESDVDLWSGGLGAVYNLQSLKTLVSAEYVANHYGIALADYGAGTSKDVGILQNIGRLGLEYSLWDLHSIWAGVEVTDYLVDRWLKLPPNMDRYNFTGGMRYRLGYWDLDVCVNYGISTKESADDDRQNYGGVVRFTHILE